MLLEHEAEFLLANLTLDFGREAKQTNGVRVGRFFEERLYFSNLTDQFVSTQLGKIACLRRAR